MLALTVSPVIGSCESTMMPQGDGTCGSAMALMWW
jgi:hypothetical protein